MMLLVMDGQKCIKTLLKINPDVKVIAISGLDKSDSLAGEPAPPRLFY